MHAVGSNTVTDYIAAVWSDKDHATLKAEKGNPRHQAEWEAYALLMAVRTWSQKLATFHGTLMVVGDAKGVLQDVVARRARSARLNLIVAEIQLELADTPHELIA